jgi:hypothetical protein
MPWVLPAARQRELHRDCSLHLGTSIKVPPILTDQSSQKAAPERVSTGLTGCWRVVLGTIRQVAWAARSWRLGQPTLSVQMKKFEDTLGHDLFDRSKRQLQLSDAGRKVFEYAKEIFQS